MKTRIRKWGNSLAVRIPKLLADELGLDQGAVVEMLLDDDALQIRPSRAEGFTLKALLSGVTRANLPSEVDTGPPVGREVW